MITRPMIARVTGTPNMFVVNVTFDTAAFWKETDRAAFMTTRAVNNVIEKNTRWFTFVCRIGELDCPRIIFCLKLFRGQYVPHQSDVVLECSTKLVHDTVQQVSIINYVT